MLNEIRDLAKQSADLLGSQPIGETEESFIGANVFDPRLGTASLTPTYELVNDHRFRLGSFYLGRSLEDDLAIDGPNGELSAAPIGHKGEGHILVCAETRTGKSERVLVPNLALWPGSALVVDCKGMLATLTAQRRGNGNPQFCDGMGQDVRVIDPMGIADVPDDMRASINPISWLTADDPNCIGKARILAEALIPDDDGKSGDPYWPNEGRELLACVMTHVATDLQYQDSERTLYRVYKLITEGDVEFRTQQIDSGAFHDEDGNELDLSAFDVLFLRMRQNPIFDSYVSIYGGGLHELFENARKQWEGIRSQAVQSLGWLAVPQMKASMEYSDVSFSRLKSDPHGCTIYLSLPSMKTYWRWVRLMVKMFAEETQSMSRPATGHQTLVILDEFTSLKAMPEMNDLMDKSAEYGIRMCVVIQRLEQLQEVYPKSWGQFFSAADVRWFFGTECHKTRDFLEKELGEREVIRVTRSVSQADGTSEQDSETTQEAVSETGGESGGGSISQSEGGGDNESDSEGTSETKGWSRDHIQRIVTSIPLLNRVLENGFFFPGNKQRNGGRTITYNRTTGKNSNWQVTEGKNWGWNISQTISTGKTVGRTTGKQTTLTRTLTESVHKRPLMAASEIPIILSKIENTDDPRYPGQALVLIRGGTRTIVRTSKYYQDPLFFRTYNKHPLYDFIQTPYPWTELSAIAVRERQVEAELRRRFAPARKRIEHKNHANLIEERKYRLKQARNELFDYQENAVETKQIQLETDLSSVRNSLPLGYRIDVETDCQPTSADSLQGPSLCRVHIYHDLSTKPQYSYSPLVATSKGRVLNVDTSGDKVAVTYLLDDATVRAICVDSLFTREGLRDELSKIQLDREDFDDTKDRVVGRLRYEIHARVAKADALAKHFYAQPHPTPAKYIDPEYRDPAMRALDGVLGFFTRPFRKLAAVAGDFKYALSVRFERFRNWLSYVVDRFLWLMKFILLAAVSIAVVSGMIWLVFYIAYAIPLPSEMQN